MLKHILQTKVLWLGLLLIALLFGVNSSLAATSLASRLSGYILLQVESLGEAWYVIPKEEKMVYMKDGAVAYQIMREVSLGITNANLAKIPVGIEARFNDVDTDSDGLSDKLEEGLETDPLKADTDGDGFKDGEEIQNNFSPLGPNKLVYDQALVNRLRGYILLQVEKQGQAWYVNPKDGKRYYMQDGPAAYNIMRYLSLGITNANLNLIPKSSRVFNVDTSGNSSNQGNQGNNNNNNNSTSTPPGNNQGGNSGGGGGGGGSTPPPSADTQSPSAPSNLSASASGTQISLSWSASTDNVGVVGYQILRSTTNGSGYTQIATSNTTSYTNTGLNIGTTYYYIVKAYDTAGNVSSNSSQTQAVAVDNQSPTVPSALTANATGVQIALAWSASTDNVGVTQYIIERSNSAIAGFATVATSTTSVYTNTRLNVNITYYYRIKAQDLAGNNSGYSEVVSATTNNELVVTDTQSPSAPSNLSASASGTQISLSWSASTDNVAVVGYQILRSTTNGSGYTQIATSNTTSHTNTGLNIGTTYYYIVKAYDAAGNVSANSVQAQATVPIPADTQAPTAPTALTATPDHREVALSWSASTDNTAVTGYQVWRSTTNGSGYVQQTTVNTTVHVDTNLTNGTVYYYIVKAYDAAGNVSNNSSQAQATPNDVQTPSAPSSLTATVSGTQSTLSWSASMDNVGVTGYQVLRSTTNGSGYTQIATSNTTSYINTGLTNGTTYYYVVRAYDAASNYSSNSNQATAAVGSTPPPTGSVSITGVSGTMSAGQTVTISGSGFGTKNRQQPLLFDDISSIAGYQGYLQNNTIVPTRGCTENSTSCEPNPQPTNASLPWYNHWYGGTPRFYIGSSSRYAGHPAYRATNLANADSRKGYFARDFAVNTSEGWTYLDWWIRSNVSFGQGPGGIVSGKTLRLWPDQNVVDQIVIADIPNPQLGMEMHSCYPSVHTSSDYFSNWPLNQWSHIGVSTKVSPSGNITMLTVNGVKVAEATDVCGGNGIYDYLRMVGLDPSYPEYLDPSLEFLWGDIYFDDSLARVIISNSSTFNPFGGTSTSNYEMQNIQSWSNNSVSFKVNPGAFTSGQTAYLYVVDSNGAINSTGYPITISGTFVADTSVPTTPTNLSASASGTSISLSWTGSNDNVGVSQYLIERSTSASSGFTQVATSNTTSYTNTGLANSTTYYYRVRAQDAAGNNSSYSSNASATTGAPTQDTQAPTTPTNLSASASGTSISLSWTGSNDNVGVSQYLIERSTSASSGFTQIATSNTTSYTNTGLANSTTYYYRVRAQDAAGNNSSYSSNASATTGAVTVNSTNLIQNSWNFSSASWDGDASGANPWSPIGNFSFTSAQSDPFGTNKAFRIALGSSGRPYQQRDSTPNLTLNYDNVVASLYVKYGNTPNLIFGLNNTTTNTEYEQTFNFNNGVPVFSSGTNDGTTVVDAGNGWYRISMRLALLSRGIKSHSFKGRVTPAGSSGTSGAYSYVTGFQLESGTTAGTYTETPSGVSDTSVPTTPTNLSASASGTSISLSWTGSNDNVGVSQYLIERSTSASSGFTQVATSNTTSYTNTGLANSTTYYYRVRAQDAAGNNSSYSSNASATTGAPTQDTSVPTTPTNLSASASGTSISLSWTGSNDNVGVSQYLIERSTSASSGFTQVATSNTTSYTNTGLANSTTYYYRVRAQDAAGNNSSYSSNASATTATVTTPPTGSVSITGVNDNTIVNGQSITISGSGFGSKSSVAPLTYDTMESGDFSTAWESHNHLVIGSDSANRRHANSTYYGTHNFQGNLYQSAGFFTGPNSQVRDTWYGRYWFKLDNNLDWGTTGETAGDGNLANVKIFRLFSPADINEDFVVATEGFSGGGIIFKDENTIDPLHYADTNISEWTKNTWHVFDFAFKEGTLGGTNGIFKMWFNGKLVADVNTLMTRQNFDLLKRPLILGFYNSWFDSNSDRDDFYIDDAYIDGTWSRVMLCNQATWDDSVSRHCEIQVPQSTWNSGSIQISFNQGSFTSGQTAYLYVVDSNGNVNSSGYPIQIASVLGDSIASCDNPDSDTLNWTSLVTGILVRGCGSSIYAIENSQRVYIPSLEVLRRDYPGRRIYNVRESLLANYPVVYR